MEQRAGTQSVEALFDKGGPVRSLVPSVFLEVCLKPARVFRENGLEEVRRR